MSCRPPLLSALQRFEGILYNLVRLTVQKKKRIAKVHKLRGSLNFSLTHLLSTPKHTHYPTKSRAPFYLIFNYRSYPCLYQIVQQAHLLIF